MEINELTYKVIGLAIEVHKELGPGLLESAYQECLYYELKKANLKVEREKKQVVLHEFESSANHWRVGAYGSIWEGGRLRKKTHGKRVVRLQKQAPRRKRGGTDICCIF